MPAPVDRINIVLPPEDRELADALTDLLGLGRGGRSAAIRYALRVAAEKHGLAADAKPKRKAKR